MIQEFTKIIVSHKRADRISTQYAISGCKVCIPESQLKEYKRLQPDLDYLTHPDDIKGISPKRQWIHDTYANYFSLDDDITGIHRVYIGPDSQRDNMLSSDEAAGLIEDLYHVARQIEGCHLFGFNRSNHPVVYKGNKPILMTQFIPSGAFGIVEGSKIFYPTHKWNIIGEDYFLNGINAHYHRLSYTDYRFAVAYKTTEHGKGGVADFTTDEVRKDAYLFLKRMFGDAIVPKKPTSLKKHLKNYEKTLKIPF